MAGMQPDPTFLSTLIEFGFDEQQAVRALRATNNAGIEQVLPVPASPLAALPPIHKMLSARSPATGQS